METVPTTKHEAEASFKPSILAKGTIAKNSSHRALMIIPAAKTILSHCGYA
jgi:hypothetical protein